VDVIQAPELEPRIMRYELSDYEWTSIKPMLPNKQGAAHFPGYHRRNRAQCIGSARNFFNQTDDNPR
jgi:transposase